MLNLLTKYLLQYRTVTIPHVGTIQIIQEPAQLSVADKIIQPPSFSAELKKEETVSLHQLNYLNKILQKNTDVVLEELQSFGDQLYDKINGPGFEWKGFGRLDRSTQSLVIPAGALNAVVAERVMREKPDHQVLVGDRETTSLQIADEKTEPVIGKKQRSVLIIIGWVLLGLSILYLAYVLYNGHFKVNASGSKQTTTAVYKYE